MQISLWGKNIRSFYCFDYAIFLTCFPIYGDREIREGDSLLEAARARQGRCLRGVGKYLPASNPSHPDMPRYVPVVYTCVCVCASVFMPVRVETAHRPREANERESRLWEPVSPGFRTSNFVTSSGPSPSLSFSLVDFYSNREKERKRKRKEREGKSSAATSSGGLGG